MPLIYPSLIIVRKVIPESRIIVYNYTYMNIQCQENSFTKKDRAGGYIHFFLESSPREKWKYSLYFNLLYMDELEVPIF